MKFEDKKIILLTEREKELFDKILESTKQADEYFAGCGCGFCPLQLSCKGYDENDCAFEKLLFELVRFKKVIEVE